MTDITYPPGSTIVAYEADGLDCVLTVTFNASPGATTLLGGTVGVDLLNTKAPTKYAGTGAPLTATTASVQTEGWAIPEGTYELHVRPAPTGYSAQTLKYTVVMKKSAAEQPA